MSVMSNESALLAALYAVAAAPRMLKADFKNIDLAVALDEDVVLSPVAVPHSEASPRATVEAVESGPLG